MGGCIGLGLLAARFQIPVGLLRARRQRETAAARGANEPAPAAAPAVDARVRGVLARTLDIHTDEIRLGASLGDDLGADSLDMCMVILELEECFGGEIPDEEAGAMLTVRDVAESPRWSRCVGDGPVRCRLIASLPALVAALQGFTHLGACCGSPRPVNGLPRTWNGLSQTDDPSPNH